MVNLTINGTPVAAPANATIYDAAKLVGIKILTLCHMDFGCFGDVHRIGSCRICVVEVAGRSNLAPACCTPIFEGMEVNTMSMRVINARRTVLDLLLSNHPKDCLTCEKNLDCELQRLTMELGLHRIVYTGEQQKHELDMSNEAIVRDLDKCIMCRRCETACNTIQTVGVLSAIGRGFSAVVAPTMKKPLAETSCTYCGQCVEVCPTGALTEMSFKYDVWRVLNDKNKHVIVQTAPAVRVALGELFGQAPGQIVTGKLVSALRMLGFKKVFDTDFAADLTIMEEAHEMVERVKKNENLPILTSCCPGWVKFIEHQFPELLHIPSTAKSPAQMFGAIAKTYYAEKMGIKPEDIVVVSVMPCLAKKYEAARPEFTHNGHRDVDIVITTRELGDMIKDAGIQFDKLPEGKYDSPLGESTGAAVIFGATGGVLEAALRTAAELITGMSLDKVDFEAVRGLSGIREATVMAGELEIKVAVASGLGNARKLLNKIKKGEAFYHAIEIMACPSGCINGGGQPYSNDPKIIEKRRQALYLDDRNSKIRKSHENPDIKKIYSEYLGSPGSPRAHELLHTKFVKRKNA